MGGTSFAAAQVAGVATVVAVLATVTAAAVVAFVAVELRRSVPLRVSDTHPWISGSPAEATVVSVESGDGVRNHVTVQCLVEFAVLEAGLRALQACEPPGVGARDLAECLELKLADAGIEPALAHAATQRLNDFAEGRWARLRRDLGQPQPVLERIALLLRGFGSAPLGEESARVDVVIPELAVEVGPQGGVMVSLLPGALPSVSVMPVQRGSLDGEKLRALHDRARRMAAAVSARRETLLMIGRHIAEVQSAFFVGRQENIHPITRAEAAASLAMHPSTLGRTIAAKALLAGSKVYPLSMFFSRALNGPAGAMSPFDVQRRIREMIDQESADAPLADEGLSAQLNKEGVDIARRTVAKYRKCMRIPSSFGRKRRKAK